MGQGLAAIHQDPEVQRAFFNKPGFFKTADAEEKHFVSIAVFACQYLFHPLIETLLSSRIENEFTTQFAQTADKTTELKETLPRINFSTHLYEALINFEADFALASDKFSLKSSIGHLRSFMEHLCQEIVMKIEMTKGVEFSGDITRPVDVRRYLSDNKVRFLNQQEVNLFASAYGYISDKAVHSLSTEREEALMCKNLAISLSALFVKRLENMISEAE